MPNDADHTFGFDGLLAVIAAIILVIAGLLSAGCQASMEISKPRYDKVFTGDRGYTAQQWKAAHPDE